MLYTDLFKAGDRVKHPAHGVGTITNVLTEARSYDVHFDTGKGYKTVMHVTVEAAPDIFAPEPSVEVVNPKLFLVSEAVEFPATTAPTDEPLLKFASDKIQSAFELFHKENPHVYVMLVELARKVKAAGRSTYGIASLFEQLRWHFEFETSDPNMKNFKLNQNYRSRYARLIMQQEADLKDFFNTRQLLAA